nr:tat (twin-arginine translocation) pathway signal sequence [Halomonas socia]
MLTTSLTRRVFLKSSGGVLAGTLALASGPIALLAPSRSWAMSLDHLSSHEGEVLLAMTRQIFPHSELEDAVYALTVKDQDRRAADSQTLDLLQQGVAELDAAAGGDWLSRAETERLAQLEAMAGSAFFEQVRGPAVVTLYDNPLAYAHFGYQGSEGDAGYLQRGFNDLTWLPDPPKPAGGYLPNESV